jgi:hypothetical protein
MLELLTSMSDARETLSFHNPCNNILIEDISRASQGNHATTYSERLNLQLNDVAHLSQTIDLEECLVRYTEEFKNASDAARHRILHELNRKLNLLASEKHGMIQNPPQLMHGRRTRGKGGRRQLTGAEIAERNLQKEAERPTESAITIVDLTTPSNSPQRHFNARTTPTTLPQRSRSTQSPFIMTFSRSGTVIRGTNELLASSATKSMTSASPTTEISEFPHRIDAEVTIISIEEPQTAATASSNPRTCEPKEQISVSTSAVESSSFNEPRRSKRTAKRKSLYQGELVLPRKSRKCG